MIVIVDYGMGNLRSVQKGFEKVGAAARVEQRPEAVRSASHLVLPGVGAFKDAIQQLRTSQLVEPIVEHLRSGRPFLGICLGMQMLFETSEEGGQQQGLGVFPGRVVRFPPMDLSVPHMGWNQARVLRPAPILDGLGPAPDVYFVHSYYVVPSQPELTATETDYPTPFTSMIWRDQIYATQFHPEKSQAVGLQLLKNFAAL